MSSNGDISDTSVETAENLYHDLVCLAREDPNNSPLLESQVQGATHLLSLYAQTKAFIKADKLFNEITHLVSQTPESPASSSLREMTAAVAVPLSAAYGDAGMLDMVRKLYDYAKELAKSFPDEVSLMESFSKISVNIAIDYINSSEVDAATEVFDVLTVLGQNHPDEESIDWERTRIVMNLFFYYIDEANDIEKGRELYRFLTKISSKYPNEPKFRQGKAEAAVSIIAKIDEAQKPTDDKQT